MTKQIMQIDVLSEWVTDDQVAEYLSEHVVTATLEVHWQHHKPGHYTGVQGWELISWNILEIALDDVELTDQDKMIYQFLPTISCPKFTTSGRICCDCNILCVIRSIFWYK